MRLKVRVPKVEPDVYEMPETCPYGCGSEHFRPHGTKGERKPLRDFRYDEVVSYRHECVRCGRTFRVYPQGVSQGAQQSDRLRMMTVLLYVLGLSYGAVEDYTVGMGCGLSKTTVYNNVQAAGVAARRKLQSKVASGGERAVIGADGTYVKVRGETVNLEVVVDDSTGELLGLDIISSEKYEEIFAVIHTVIEEVEPDVLVSDDHGAYNGVVDEEGLDHQICRSHVKRNTDQLSDSIDKHLERAEPLPEGVELSPDQVRADLEQMEQLVRERPPDGEEQLAEMYQRYKKVPKPKGRQKHSVWYRARMMVTRLWTRWRCLTLDQRRKDQDMDGTNNSSERLIGWWIKERYRSMRGYKREESIRNVVTLTALIGASSDVFDLGSLLA